MDTAIAGVGCSLMDYLFTGLQFGRSPFKDFCARAPGDGGLIPGQLVFAEGLERFTGKPYQEVLREITGGADPASSNLGGPSVVALVHAAQMLAHQGTPVEFYGVRGDDSVGDQLASILSHTPLHWDNYMQVRGSTPFTHALSDPTYADGAGERSFVNSIGVAGGYRAEQIPDSFFDHPITAFGGTGLVPALHAELHIPVSKAHRNGAITVINTVYDFLNESRAPDKVWPLGDSPVTYAATDLLIVDAEEARRLSGAEDMYRAIQVFRDAGVSAVIITRGAEPVIATAGSTLGAGRFADLEPTEFPVCRQIRVDIDAGRRQRGDTTGCGDNFVGGVLYSLAEQHLAGERRLDLVEAVRWGVASGGYACFYLGGTYLETRIGEKRQDITHYYEEYRKQINE